MRNRGFEKFYKDYNEKKLTKILNETYEALSRLFNREVTFGKEGIKEFLGAILLFKYDKSCEEKIVMGICKMFQRKFTPLDFSEYMEYIIENSLITIEEWHDVYDYIDKNHRWIENHRCV